MRALPAHPGDGGARRRGGVRRRPAGQRRHRLAGLARRHQRRRAGAGHRRRRRSGGGALQFAAADRGARRALLCGRGASGGGSGLSRADPGHGRGRGGRRGGGAAARAQGRCAAGRAAADAAAVGAGGAAQRRRAGGAALFHRHAGAARRPSSWALRGLFCRRCAAATRQEALRLDERAKALRPRTPWVLRYALRAAGARRQMERGGGDAHRGDAAQDRCRRKRPSATAPCCCTKPRAPPRPRAGPTRRSVSPPRRMRWRPASRRRRSSTRTCSSCAASSARRARRSRRPGARCRIPICRGLWRAFRRRAALAALEAHGAAGGSASRPYREPLGTGAAPRSRRGCGARRGAISPQPKRRRVPARWRRASAGSWPSSKKPSTTTMWRRRNRRRATPSRSPYGVEVNRALWHGASAIVRKNMIVRMAIAASHTPPWLASGWGCRGRRLSRA